MSLLRFILLLCLLLLFPFSLSLPEEEEKMVMLWMKSFRTTKDSPPITQEKVTNREDWEREFAADRDAEITVPKQASDTVGDIGKNGGDSIDVENFSLNHAPQGDIAAHESPKSQRIKQGREVFGNAPWMVSISDMYEGHVCGGVLISSRFVLTAAHCLENAYAVSMGSLLLFDQRRIIRQILTFINDIYIPDHYHHDIALLELNEVRLTRYVQTARLPSQNPDVGSPCKIYGWGKYHRGTIAKRLRVAEVNVVDIQKCQRAYPSRVITDDHICAGNQWNGADACEGDSGGPLMCEDNDGIMTLFGIISYGRRCGSNSYGVYTSVYKHINWIEDYIEQDLQ